MRLNPLNNGFTKFCTSSATNNMSIRVENLFVFQNNQQRKSVYWIEELRKSFENRTALLRLKLRKNMAILGRNGFNKEDFYGSNRAEAQI